MESMDSKALAQVWRLIQESHLVLKKDTVAEIYHHLGEVNFPQTGAVFINIVNREYCKSYVVLLPEQEYPNHYHKIKTETFYMLYGDLTVNREGKEQFLKPGDSMTIERGESHSFKSKAGAVFEELSTTYIKNDSVYENESIREQSYIQRKTRMTISRLEEMIKNGKG